VNTVPVGNFELRSSRRVNVVVWASLITVAMRQVKRNPILHMKLILPGECFEQQLFVNLFRGRGSLGHR
jgi:hypothetical protein